MKTRLGVKIISLLFAVAFVSSLIGYIAGARTSRRKDAPGEVRTATAFPLMKSRAAFPTDKILSEYTVGSDITQYYILRDDGGVLTLFCKYSDGREELYQHYDVPVTLLPESDRELLKKGIRVDALSDALQLVEDYSS